MTTTAEVRADLLRVAANQATSDARRYRNAWLSARRRPSFTEWRWLLSQTLVRTAERDNARAWAVHLEQELAHLREQITQNSESAILARLEAKSSHDYQWPRWPAAYEAAQAVTELLDTDA